MKDSNVYIKNDNGRYEAIGLQYDRDWLGDGIWSVQHRKGSTSIRNLTYYGGIYKVGDVKYPDFSKLAGILGINDMVLQSDAFKDIMHNNKCWDEIVSTILSEAVRISEEIEEKSKKRPLREINGDNLGKDGFKFNPFSNQWTKKIDGTWYEVFIFQQDNKRFWDIIVQTTYDHTKIAEFRAEFMHQIYNLINNL